MSIKPIDLQTNMGQIHEISKGEKMRTDGLVEQQHLLERSELGRADQIDAGSAEISL